MIQRDLHPFTLTTQADFARHGVWLIEADFSFHKTAKGPIRGLLNRARLAIVSALTRQALQGWSRGARMVQVRLASGRHRIDFILPRRTLTSNLFLL